MQIEECAAFDKDGWRKLMSKSILSKKTVDLALENTVFDLGNQVLYDLCANYPSHKEADQIHAKIMIIGRAYAATIERRKKHLNLKGDKFIFKKVIPIIQLSKVDSWIQQAKKDANTFSRVSSILTTHANVTKLFSRISGTEKRSLASKYLHFHCPDLFYIYDSRAQRAVAVILRGLASKGRDKNQSKEVTDKADMAYRTFFLQCEHVNDAICKLIGRRLTPREMDKVLLEYAAK